MRFSSPLRHVIERGSRPPLIHVDRDTPTRDAAMLMRDGGAPALAISFEEDGCGLLTERQIVRSVIARGLDPDETPAGWLVWQPALAVAPSDAISDVLRMMARHPCEQAVVVERGELVAIVTLEQIAMHLGLASKPSPPGILRLVRGEEG